MGKILGILADHFMTCAKLPPPNSALRCSCGQIVYAHQHCPTSVSPPQAFCQALYVVVVGCFRASAIPVAALGGVILVMGWEQNFSNARVHSAQEWHSLEVRLS